MVGATDEGKSSEAIICLIALCLVTFLTIFGNAFILACICFNKSLQRPGHLFIGKGLFKGKKDRLNRNNFGFSASLAVTDMLLGLTVMVPRLSDEILEGWHFGYLLCQVIICLRSDS